MAVRKITFPNYEVQPVSRFTGELPINAHHFVNEKEVIEYCNSMGDYAEVRYRAVGFTKWIVIKK